jgi:biopolymer transport protein ExbB/TolQ
MHFSPKVVTILGITLPVIMLSATVVGIMVSIILMAFFERHRSYIGNIVLPINDFLNTLIYLRIARLML